MVFLAVERPVSDSLRGVTRRRYSRQVPTDERRFQLSPERQGATVGRVYLPLLVDRCRGNDDPFSAIRMVKVYINIATRDHHVLLRRRRSFDTTRLRLPPLPPPVMRQTEEKPPTPFRLPSDPS